MQTTVSTTIFIIKSDKIQFLLDSKHRPIKILSSFDAIFNNTPIAVTVDHVERANKVMQYFVNSSRTIFTKADKVKEINNVVSVKKGMTKAETIMFLHDKGYINADIAKKIDVSKVYVGQIIAKNTQNTPPKVK